MEILEQLQNKINQTIQSLENLQLSNMELQEELDQARSQLSETQQALETAQQQNAELSEEKAQLQQQHNDVTEQKNAIEARVQSLLQTLDIAVSDLMPVAADSAQEDVQEDLQDSSVQEDLYPNDNADEQIVQQANDQLANVQYGN
ncbi:hypothetical protein [Oceanobacter kriegii]|uniref:hypothetical protein n=1 Tax=Oceanobacter kriegii TaxID=64972 RepID=UPI001FE19CB0|nr:hypothetical protein [Oceanobacter kriegii]